MSIPWDTIISWKPLILLLCLGIMGGCADVLKPDRPAAVQEIHPGILAGYLRPEALPDSLALVAPPPVEGSAAFVFDKEVSRKSLSLQGAPRWKLAAEGAELRFPAAGSLNM